MTVIATDLDRTLFPNGRQEYDNSMGIFKKIIRDKQFTMVYVTGRDLPLIKEGISEYAPPLPKFAIAEVGTKIYSRKNEVFREDKDWIELIASVTKNWDTAVFEEEVIAVHNLRLQERERQNQFKSSYYVDDLTRAKGIVEEVTKIIKAICEDTTIIYSVDETNNLGLLDILPKRANKIEGLEYIRKKEGMEKDDIVYAGDSGNDILPLTFGYKSILVKNAIEEVKEKVRGISREKNILDKLYISQGYKKLNGYYVSGIIEGLIHFGLVSADYAE